MTATNFFHIGILVLDLDEAIERLSDTLGLNFNPPTEVHFDRLVDRVEMPFTLRATYSREGSPHLELIEAVGDGIYSPAHGEGLHHLGMWVPDPHQAREELAVKNAVTAEAAILNPDGTTRTWYSLPASMHGVRVEYVDVKRREVIERWIQGLDDTIG
jgi:catechol 2,3-dioxygenase-like lactoylglutathione lyase family enzyme